MSETVVLEQSYGGSSRSILYISYVKGSEDKIQVSFEVYSRVLEEWYPITELGLGGLVDHVVELTDTTNYRAVSCADSVDSYCFNTQTETEIRYTITYVGVTTAKGTVDIRLVPDSPYVNY